MPFVRQVRCRRADYSLHKNLLKIAGESAYTRGFADVRYVQSYYEAGWIGAATYDGDVVGFVCIRHCIRNPWTTIYYLGITKRLRGRGLGKRLLDWVEAETPHEELRLGVDESNVGALAFWEGQGFSPLGVFTSNKAGGKIWQMAKRKTPGGKPGAW